MATQYKKLEQIYFAYLRNVTKDSEVNRCEIRKALSAQNALKDTAIPFRPDRGHQMSDDLSKQSKPAYSAIGRLRGWPNCVVWSMV